MSEQFKVISFGGGVQSTALLVLAAQGKIDYKTFVFSNVGHDSEYPETLRYVEEVAKPYAEAHGISLITIQKTRRDGTPVTLYSQMTRPGSNSFPIPLYGEVDEKGKAAPGRRACTYDYKTNLIARWTKKQGATADNPCIMAIGISLDEFERMKDSTIPWHKSVYPLIDLRLDRFACKRIIAEAGLPVPPKSSCYFCPFHSLRAWQRLYDNHPDLFQKSVDLERMINQRRAARAEEKGTEFKPNYLTAKMRPLDEVIDGSHQNQLTMFEEEDAGQYSCGPFTCSGGVG